MSAADTAIHPQDFTHLYRNHHGWLLTFLQRRLSNQSDAADLAQDTFLRLLLSDQRLELQEPKAFLTTIAQRVLCSHWRRERIEKAYLEALAQQPEAYAASPEEREIMIETLLEIDRLLDGLPVIVRRVFFHAQLDGMKQQEIADTLGISISTVKRHLRRAAMQCYFAISDE